MKAFVTKLALLVCATTPALAQTPSLEFFAGAENPTNDGPTVANQAITFQNNANNPSDNVAIAATPNTTVSFSLSNQQYGSSDTRRGLMFGGQTSNASAPIGTALFPTMDGLSGPGNTSALYTSVNGFSGGIDVTTNRSVELATDVQYTGQNSNARRDWYADLTLIFNRPITNPVLHLTGLGVNNNGVGASTELQILTAGVSLSKLSGSPSLSVSATDITNVATSPDSNTGSTTVTGGAVSGSVLATTPAGGITQLVLRVYLRKRAGFMFATPPSSYTDGWLLGVSARNPFPLPVTLTSFTAQAAPHNTEATVRWNTASEVNNDYFDVERSLDGKSFVQLGKVRGQGNKTTPTGYTFTDASIKALAGVVYYRLRQVDLDGRSTYSPVRTLSLMSTLVTISLAPNPATNTTELDLTSLPTGTYQVAILDMMGRSLLHQELAAGRAYALPLDKLSSGPYVVLVQGAALSLRTRLSKR